MTWVNHPSTYKYPLYLLTDESYSARGAVSLEGPEGRYVGRDTSGRVLFDRKDGYGVDQAAKRAGFHLVSSSWYGVEPGLPVTEEVSR